MRKAVTLRFDPSLLAQARRRAAEENRTLTSLIETMIKRRVGTARPSKEKRKASGEEPAGVGTGGAP